MKILRNKRCKQIVINTNGGSFSLSPKATVDYYRRKGIKIVCYRYDYVANNRIPLKSIASAFVECTEECAFVECTEECAFVEYRDALTGDYLSNRDMPRDDLDLIDTVEALGEGANGFAAKLKIVEIPSNVEWEIREYGGIEEIAEKHRVWC